MGGTDRVLKKVNNFIKEYYRGEIEERDEFLFQGDEEGFRDRCRLLKSRSKELRSELLKRYRAAILNKENYNGFSGDEYKLYLRKCILGLRNLELENTVSTKAHLYLRERGDNFKWIEELDELSESCLPKGGERLSSLEDSLTKHVDSGDLKRFRQIAGIIVSTAKLKILDLRSFFNSAGTSGEELNSSETIAIIKKAKKYFSWIDAYSSDSRRFKVAEEMTKSNYWKRGESAS